MSYFNLSSLFLIFAFSSFGDAQASPANCLLALSHPSREVIELNMGDSKFNQVSNNAFMTGRGFQDYRGNFGKFFEDKLASLGENDTWIDMGAGDAVAMTELLKRAARWKKKPVPNLLALGFTVGGVFGEFPQDLEDLEQYIQERVPLIAHKFNYIEGLQTPETLVRLPHADIITDMWGILYYTDKNRVRVLEAYAEILKPDGLIFLNHRYDEAVQVVASEKSNLEMVYIDRGLTILRKLKPK